MATLFALIGLVGIVVGIIAYFKKGLEPFRIPNRKVAVYVLIGSLLLFFVTGAFLETDDDLTQTDENESAIQEEQQEDNNYNEKQTDENVNENTEAEEDLRDLSWIEGETNIEDGTIISYEIENVDNIDDWLEGEIEVVDGSFSETVDISGPLLMGKYSCGLA